MPGRKPKANPIVDTGTPPASIVAMEKLKEDILSAPDDAVLISKEAEPESATVIKPTNIPEVQLEKVKLEHTVYTVSFGILDISISEHQIAIKIPNSSSFKFEPKVDSRFVIHYRGRTYAAVYLGGIFNFESDSSWAITFILESSDKDDGEEQ